MFFFFQRFQPILAAKQRISAALMMENPVSSPMVPPIADNISTNFAALSLVILSNVGVSKQILTSLSLFFHSCMYSVTYGYVVTLLQKLYSLMMGNKVSKSFSNLDLEKLVTMRPEQGFRQLEVSIFKLVIQFSSCGEVQMFS